MDFKDIRDTEGNLQGCGNETTALIYFISFMIIVSFIFLNLFIAIILESFETSQDEESLKVGGATIGMFNELWSNEMFDPKGSRFISVDVFPDLMDKLIDEEIRQYIIWEEKVRNRELGIQDLLNVQVTVFNIHKDPLIVPIFFKRKPIIYAQMVEDGSVELSDQEKEKKQMEKETEELNRKSDEKEIEMKEGGDVMMEGGDVVVPPIPQISNKKTLKMQMTKKERLSIIEQKLLEKMKNKFIGSLKIPCYDNCKFYYYYDVLEALSRHLFQNIIYQRKLTIDKEDQAKILKSRMNTVQSQIQAGHQKSQVSVSLEDSEDSSDDEDLTEIEIEDQNDIVKGSLDEILRKLEEKGQERDGDNNIKISMYKEMREWRLKRDKDARDKLYVEYYNHNRSGKIKSIFDSSQIVGAKAIQKYIKRIKKRMAIRGGKKSNRQIELEQQKRVKNEERDRLAKIKAEQEAAQVGATGRLQQIQEVGNEDRDLTTERAGNPNVNPNVGQGLDRCSEPGNKQGEESPSHPDQGEYQRHISGGSSFNNERGDSSRARAVDIVRIDNNGGGQMDNSYENEGERAQNNSSYQSKTNAEQQRQNQGPAPSGD